MVINLINMNSPYDKEYRNVTEEFITDGSFHDNNITSDDNAIYSGDITNPNNSWWFVSSYEISDFSCLYKITHTRKTSRASYRHAVTDMITHEVKRFETTGEYKNWLKSIKKKYKISGNIIQLESEINEIVEDLKFDNII